MIRNVLFDMGNVLIRWDPAAFIRRAGVSEADGTLLMRAVYGSAEWPALDRGTLTDDEALAIMDRKLPARLHPAADELVRRWDTPYWPVDGMPALAAELSRNGYGLYLLTNASLRHRAYWPRFPVAAWFGDRVFRSADWGLLKPEAAFYETALERFGLDRRDCIFIDDSPLNVEAARHIGLDALVFHGDAALLRAELRDKGVDLGEGGGT